MLKSINTKTVIISAVAVICAGIGAYVVKTTSGERNQELRQIISMINEEKDIITVLEADWSYLTRPSRIQHLSREMLSFAPIEAKRILTLDALERAKGGTNVGSGGDDSTLFQIKEIKGLE